MLISLAIFVAVLGGFLFNAETVSTCETDWEYVTDIGGAFVGDDSDLDVEYDPTDNVTGWSVFSGYNHGRISGVDYKTTTATNAYRATVGDPETVPYAVTVQADVHDGVSYDQTYTATTRNGSNVVVGTFDGTMPRAFGVYNPEAVVLYTCDDGDHPGAFGLSLMDLGSIIPDYIGLDSIELSVSSVSGLPAFAVLTSETGRGQFVHAGRTYTPTIQTWTASSFAASIIVDVATGIADVNGTKAPSDKVFLVWGQAQFNSNGAYSDTVIVQAQGLLEAPTAFIDPSMGVIPTAGTYTESVMDYVSHEGSSSPNVRMEFTADGSENAVQGTVSYVPVGSTSQTQLFSFYFSGSRGSQGTTAVTVTGGTQVSDSNYDGTGLITMSKSGSTVIVYAGTTLAGTVTASAMASIVIALDQTTAMPDYVFTVENDNGTGQTFTNDGDDAPTYTASLAWSEYTSTTTTTSYTSVYWNNNQSNASVSIVLVQQRNAASHVVPSDNELYFIGPSGTISVETSCDASGRWTVAGTDMGIWPGMMLTAGYGTIKASPLTSFRNFLDYEVLDRSTAVSGYFDDVTTSIQVDQAVASDFRMSVVKTVARLYEGGLFLQDASMTLSNSFPDVEAASLMIGSAARLGDSVSFASGGSTATLLVEADKKEIYVGGKWRPINGVYFRWISSAAPDATVGDMTYQPGLYMNGQTYEAGKIWAQTRDGKMTEVMDAAQDWTVTLDGVWAPSVFFYTGENEASSTTQLADFTDPEFQWNKTDFLLVMMAIVILGGLAGYYFGKADIVDWLVIFGAVGVIWLIL